MAKDCHFFDGKRMDSDKCANYLHRIKNQLLKSNEITSVTDVPLNVLDTLLKKHQMFASLPMKHSIDTIELDVK